MFEIAKIFLAACLLTISLPAAAYVGPGLGAGILGVIVGFTASVLLALFSIVWFPLKRLFKGRQQRKDAAPAEDDEDG